MVVYVVRFVVDILIGIGSIIMEVGLFVIFLVLMVLNICGSRVWNLR